MFVKDLVNIVRPRLGDVDKNKFTDDRLIQLVNEGCEEIVRYAAVNKAEALLPVVEDTNTVSINDVNFIKLLRATFNNSVLKVISYDELDRITNWQTRKSTKITHIVSDFRNIRDLLIYPKLQSIDKKYLIQTKENGVITDIKNAKRTGAENGMVTDITIKYNDKDQVSKASNLGGINNLLLHTAFIYIQYIRKIDNVSKLDDDLKLDESFKSPLIWFICGMALLDNVNTQEIQKGRLFLDKYNSELAKIMARTATSSQQVKGYTVNYRGIQ